MSILKIFMIFGLVGDWYKKAMADGVVTLPELVELGVSLGKALGFSIAPEVMAVITETAGDVIEGIEDGLEVVEDVVSVLEHDL